MDFPNHNGWASSLVRDLLRWYARSHRAMPWRAPPGDVAPAYAVLVSETMLQQTQVATVIDYFERFVRTLPDIAALAAADEQQVLRLWQGLGYYRRARHLHAAAKRIVEVHNGRIPDTVAELEALPGVGRYTAGAVASIAFARPAAVVDGNVARVLARLLAIDAPIDSTPGRKRLWAEAEALIGSVGRSRVRHRRRKLHAGDWNQALMELGATICAPRQPWCDRCPVRGHCMSFANGRTAELPVKGRRAVQRSVVHHMLAIERRGRLLFEQRDTHGLWAGMWQMPTLADDAPVAATASSNGRHRTTAPPSGVAQLAEKLNLRIARPRHVGGFGHMTTHRRIRFELWHTRCEAGRPPLDRARWRRPDDLDDLPLPRPQQHALEMLQSSSPGLHRVRCDAGDLER